MTGRADPGSRTTLRRDRLLTMLDEAYDLPVVQLVAAAGYGKTTLLGDWARMQSGPVAWLTLKRRDNDLGGFTTRLIRAIQQVQPDIGEATLASLEQPALATPRPVGELLGEELHGLTDDLIVVIDDVQAITDPAPFAMLGTALSPAPSRLHLILASRMEPGLPGAQLRARGQLLDIRTGDLRFTHDETRQYVRKMLGHHPAPDLVDALHEWAEGWPAGLRLAMQALKGGLSAEQVRLALRMDGLPNAMAFLLNEVLEQLPADLAELLARTSIASRISVDLAGALMPEPCDRQRGRVLLRRLVASDLFVSFDDESGEWFRYHHLFRQLLRDRLDLRLGDEGVAALRLRAAGWFEARGQIDEAIEQAQAACRPDLAGALVERHALTVSGFADHRQLERWVQQLPAEVAGRSADLQLARAWGSLLRGMPAVARQLLVEVGSSLAGDGPAMTRTPATEGLHALAVAALAFLDDEFARSVDASIHALAHMPKTAASLRHEALVLLAMSAPPVSANGRAQAEIRREMVEGERETGFAPPACQLALGIIAFAEGQLHAAAALFSGALDGGHLPVPETVEVGARCFLGQVLYQWNRLADAAEQFQLAIDRCELPPLWYFRDSLSGLARIDQAEGQAAMAFRRVDRLMSAAISGDAHAEVESIRSLAARLALMGGDPASAFAWLASGADHDPAAVPTPLTPDIRPLVVAGLHLATGRFAEALDLLRRFRRQDGFDAVRHHAISADALEAAALDGLGRGEEAAACLETALRRAAPGGYVRLWLDLGEPVERMVARHVPAPDVAPYHAMLRERLAPLAPDRPDGMARDFPARAESRGWRPERVEPLSAREQEVLEGMRRRLSDKEIGEELRISPLTVKRHASNIYGKLGVSSRREAVRRAEELGMLLAC